MKLAKRFVALLMGATLVVGSAFGLAACNGDRNDDQIRAVYDLYVQNCAVSNTTPFTYEEWLASIKGAKGDKGDPGQDGITPHIDPETGNWFIGDADTGIKAAGTNGTNGTNGSNGLDGSNGVTPHIGSNGNWFIGDEDTHVKAAGTDGSNGTDGKNGIDGQNGANGANGTSFRHGHGIPDSDLGIDGDLYVDVDTWDVYERTQDGWSTTPIGNIKGADGKDASSEPSDVSIKTWNNVTVQKDGTQTLACTGLEAGLYWLVAETETEAAIGVLKASWTNPIDTGAYSNKTVNTDLYSPTNGFKGVVYVSGTESLTLSTSQDSVTANYKLYNYEPVTVTANTECEIPMTVMSLPSVPLVFDSALTGTVKVSLIGVPDSFAGLMLYYVTEVGGSQTRAGIFQKNKSFVNEAIVLNSAAVEWYVMSAGGSSIEPYFYNIRIKIEVA